MGTSVVLECDEAEDAVQKLDDALEVGMDLLEVSHAPLLVFLEGRGTSRTARRRSSRFGTVRTGGSSVIARRTSFNADR